jgi:hypothetical protein
LTNAHINWGKAVKLLTTVPPSFCHVLFVFWFTIQRPIKGISVLSLIPQLHFLISHFSQSDAHHFLISLELGGHHSLQSIGEIYSVFDLNVLYTLRLDSSLGGSKRQTQGVVTDIEHIETLTEGSLGPAHCTGAVYTAKIHSITRLLSRLGKGLAD